MARTKRPNPPCLSQSEEENSSSSESEQEEEVEVPLINQDNSDPDIMLPPPTASKEKKSSSSSSSDPAPTADPAPTSPTKSVKRTKKKKNISSSDPAGTTAEAEKKPLFQRVWTEADEIALLESAVQFKTQGGVDPDNDFNSFYDFTKNRGGGALVARFKKPQFKEKYTRLHKRYLNKKDKDNNFQHQSGTHHHTIYHLSRQIWSTQQHNNNNNNKMNNAGSSKSEVKGNKRRRHIVFTNKNTSVEDMILNITSDELKERWRNLEVAQLKLFIERNELVRDQAEMYLDALKSTSNH